MTRTFETTDEQDAALAWRVAELKADGVTEDSLIAAFADAALAELVATFRRTEADRVADAFQSATLDQRLRVKAVLAKA